MTTTLLAAEQLLSKQLGDYWASTTTSAGSSAYTSLIDTSLKAKQNDWITKESYDLITSTAPAYTGEERLIYALDNSTGTITTQAHSAQIATAITYEVHRLFSASEKQRALIAAAKNIFPSCFQEVWDETLISGNWLKDGSFERWTSTAVLTDWTKSSANLTLLQTSTLPYYKHGSYSAKLTSTLTTDYLTHSITNFADLQFLRGRSVTFTCQGWCDTASCLRLSINDGTTQTYSSYHAGDNTWTEDDPREDSFYVTQYIDPNATQVTFAIHHSVAAAVSYVDDARVISEPRSRLYIGHLGLAQNRPHRVEIEPSYYSQEEPWYLVRDTKVDTGGYLYLPYSTIQDRRLRIRGVGYLDFLASGVSSTAWTATINIDSPQLEILVAGAALYLYTQMSMPNFSQGTREKYMEMIGYWTEETKKRAAQFGMRPPPTTIHWG